MPNAKLLVALSIGLIGRLFQSLRPGQGVRAGAGLSCERRPAALACSLRRPAHDRRRDLARRIWLPL